MIKFFNKKGFTLVEMMIAGGILAVVIMVTTQGMSVVFKEMRRTSELSEKRAVISNLMKSVRANPRLYQAHFISYTDQEREAKLQKDNLPLAWDSNGIYEKADCASCVGRLGIMIEPSGMVAGAFIMRMRLFDKGSNGEDIKADYYMLFGD